MESSDSPLVLFDIDGTLLRRAGPAHRESLERAVWLVARVKATVDGIPVAEIGRASGRERG